MLKIGERTCDFLISNQGFGSHQQSYNSSVGDEMKGNAVHLFKFLELRARSSLLVFTYFNILVDRFAKIFDKV